MPLGEGITAGMEANKTLKKERNYRPAESCEHCYKKDSSYFSDMVACNLLNWSYGDDVYPHYVCDEFKRAEDEQDDQT